eukprot:6180450-Pleurochrysis_carterae.AAC.3
MARSVGEVWDAALLKHHSLARCQYEHSAVDWSIECGSSERVELGNWQCSPHRGFRVPKFKVRFRQLVPCTDVAEARRKPRRGDSSGARSLAIVIPPSICSSASGLLFSIHRVAARKM